MGGIGPHLFCMVTAASHFFHHLVASANEKFFIPGFHGTSLSVALLDRDISRFADVSRYLALHFPAQQYHNPKQSWRSYSIPTICPKEKPGRQIGNCSRHQPPKAGLNERQIAPRSLLIPTHIDPEKDPDQPRFGFGGIIGWPAGVSSQH